MMNDTVTRLMALAEKYAANYRAHYLPTGDENVNITEARQALQDELQKLFTPLSDMHIKSIYNRLCDSEGASYGTMARAVEAVHGIGEKK